ncbi:MAG: 3'-5' exonuclease [Bacteroidales bacterium]|nr:3'-5' exonuclease [Bacteroidales bacterium]
MELKLERPIVFFDLETTGLQIGSAHVVQIGLIKVSPDGTEESRTYLVRPADAMGRTLPIPPETTAIHHITDAMVADKPTFKELALELKAFIGDADMAGYNSNKFDVPLLVEEFLRAGVDFDIQSRHLVDVQNIFHKMESRTLVAAYRFYCHKELEGAHSADADIRATYEVLKAQLDCYDGAVYKDNTGKESKPIVNDIAKLAAFTTSPMCADLAGFLGYDARHNMVFNFGKHKGKPVKEVFKVEPSYYRWIEDADFPLITKKVLKDLWDEMHQEEKLKSKFIVGSL